MAWNWLKSSLVVVTRQLSHVMLVQGSHRQCGVATAVPAQQHSGSVSGRGWYPHSHWEWREGTVMCVSTVGREKEIQEKTRLFFLTPAGREAGFSPVERPEVRAQITDGPQGLVDISIRVSDELVWMFLKEGGVFEDGGVIFSTCLLFYLLLSFGRSEIFLRTGHLQNKLLVILVRVAETDPMNPNIRAS